MDLHGFISSLINDARDYIGTRLVVPVMATAAHRD